MSSSDIIVTGLDEAEMSLAKFIDQTYPSEFRKMVVSVAEDLKSAVQDKTPVDTQYLQDHWFVGEIKKIGHEYLIEVYNNEEYVEPVEYGHRTKNGGQVAGAHMMEVSIETLKVLLPQYLKDWLSTLLERLEL